MKYLARLNDTAECYGYTVRDEGIVTVETRFRVYNRSNALVYQVPALMLIEGWLDGMAHAGN